MHRMQLLALAMILSFSSLTAACAHKIYWVKPGEQISPQEFETDKLECMQYANANTPRLAPIMFGSVPVDMTPKLMLDVWKSCMRAKGYVEGPKP